jgi:hypothetical protein
MIIAGWIEEGNAYGLRVGSLWVPWAIGAPPRPFLGEYAEVEIDDEGYATQVVVRAWRPVPPHPN